MSENNSIVNLLWLRRDLRLHDNLTLAAAVAEKLPIQPIFIFDLNILSRFKNKQDKRLSFIAESLTKLDQDLQKYGGKLLVFYGHPEEIIPELARKFNSKSVFAGKDYEPKTIKRDLIVEQKLLQFGIKLQLKCDHLIIPPEKISKKDGTAFKIFTPFSRQWRSQIDMNHYGEYQYEQNNIYNSSNFLNLGLDITKGAAHLLKQIDYTFQPLGQWQVDQGEKRLNDFIQNNISSYHENRNFPGMTGTSQLSPYIRFGLISIRQCYRQAIRSENPDTWVNELIWREFYISILYNFPETEELEFLPHYRDLNWQNNELLLKKWQQGETGFPIIDAAMRELHNNNWMHNRCRMIVASFLCKDLLLDWRYGEEFFAQHLMDYELASNVGGWQWAASVGTDAQPYFRIFNPSEQQKKFDPEGVYIKKYLPELSNVPIQYLSNPKSYNFSLNYPSPVVDHASARLQALKLYKKLL